MFLHLPCDRPLPLVFVTDYRSKTDAQLDAAYREDHPASPRQHVLEFFKLAQSAIGRGLYAQCPRIALFEHDAEPTPQDRRRARTELARWLAQNKPRVSAIIPNEVGGESSKGSTLSWQHFGAPDSAGNMRGTFYEYASNQFATPLHPYSPWAKQLTIWQQSRFIARAFAVAMGREKLLTCKHKFTDGDDKAKWALVSMERKPLAIDIESIESTDTITAIGVSDGHAAVSVPWDRFQPAGRDEPEPGLAGRPYGNIVRRELVALLAAPTPKIFHNHTFDVPRLQQDGLVIGGEIHDTFAAHAIAFPELRHGLQHACADMLPIRPWKSIWHPKMKGVTRDDEEFWSCDPEALRDYNADDAYHTHHLARSVFPCVGVNL